MAESSRYLHDLESAIKKYIISTSYMHYQVNKNIPNSATKSRINLSIYMYVCMYIYLHGNDIHSLVLKLDQTDMEHHFQSD